MSSCTWIVQDLAHREVNARADGYPCQMGSVQSLYGMTAKAAGLVAMSLPALRGLTQMNGIPPVQNASTSESPDTHSEECPICIEKYSSWTVKIECGHKFCGICFVKLVLSATETCPMCRGPLLTRTVASSRSTNPEPGLMSVNDSRIETMGYSANADITPSRF